MSIHSLYYLTPKEVLELTHRSTKGRLFAVFHRFADLYGTLHDNGDFVESSYETFIDARGEAQVRMQVTGNCTSYTHNSLAWLSTTYYEEKGQSMCWSGRPCGDSWIYEFVKTPQNLVIPHKDCAGTMSLTRSLSRKDHVGSVSGVLTPGDEGAFKPMLTVMKLQESKIHSFGSFLWVTRGHDKTILLPKGVVEVVAAKMVGIPRDKAGLRLCINTMKQTVKPDKMSMPDAMRLNCIIYGSAMAFVLTLKDEVTVFNELCSPFYKRLYASLSGVMNLDSIFTWWCCGAEGFNATVEEYEATRASAPGQTFDAKKAWPKGLPGYESRRPLRDIRVGAELEGVDRTEIEDKPQFHPICTTFSNYIPIVPYASVNNECVSLANRAMMVVPESEQEIWELLHSFAEHEMEVFEPMVCNLEEDFANWNAKFDTNKQRKHVVAWEDLKTTPLNKKDFVRKQFVKRELTMKGGESPEEFDPRSILACTDRLNVSLGPFVAKASAQLKEKWNPHSRICYSAGMTAEEIGEWRAQFGDEKVTILETDEKRYDSHQDKNAYRATSRLNKRMGIDQHGDASFAYTANKQTAGWSSAGVRFKVDDIMGTGIANTSYGNSYLNALKIAFALSRFGITDFYILVHGDDSLVVIRGHYSVSFLSNLRGGFLSIQRSLGFETKLKISTEWSQVEYCSSLFWPVEGGYVLGPKIGKRLPKIGFSLTKLDEGEVKGMLLGLSVEAGFVPVLRVYAKHQLSLLKRVAKKSFTDKRTVYKSFATTKHVCNEDTAYFFLERYGFDMEEMETLLSRSLTSNLTDCVNYPALSLFTAIDL
jgi:hypothetical protein